MKQYKRPVGVLSLILGLIAVSTAAGQAKPVELRFSWWGGEPRNVMYNQIADRFEADNPGIKIVREPISWNDYFTKIPTEVAANAAPDIIQMHARYVKLFSDRNALLPLDDLIKKGAIDESKFSKASTLGGLVNGKAYLVSIGATSTGLAFNTALAKKIGIKVPTEQLTWSQYEALLVDAQKRLGAGYYAGSDDSMAMVATSVPFTIFMRSRGKDFFTTEGKLGFKGEDLKDWLALYDRLRKASAVPTPQISAEEASKTYEQQIGATGKQLVMFLPVNRLKIYQDLIKDQRLELARAPKGSGPGEYIEGAHIAINAKTKHPAEAAKFINFFVNSKRSLELYKAENGFPASSVMSDYIFDLLDPSNQQAAKYMARIGADAGISPYVIPPNTNADVIRLLDAESQAFAFGKKALDKAVADFFKAYENL